MVSDTLMQIKPMSPRLAHPQRASGLPQRRARASRLSEDHTTGHRARLEMEQRLGGGNKGTRGILVTDSEGQSDRERAQHGVGVRASPRYLLCNPGQISQPL